MLRQCLQEVAVFVTTFCFLLLKHNAQRNMKQHHVPRVLDVASKNSYKVLQDHRIVQSSQDSLLGERRSSDLEDYRLFKL